MADAKDMTLARHRGQIAVLLRALGLNPNDIAEDVNIDWDGDNMLYIERYVRGEDGKLIYDAGQAKRELAVVTVETDMYAIKGGGSGD